MAEIEELTVHESDRRKQNSSRLSANSKSKQTGSSQNILTARALSKSVRSALSLANQDPNKLAKKYDRIHGRVSYA